MDVKALLIKHEDLKLKPYRCTSGKLTIGAGRNLDDKGLTCSESLFLLENDIAECRDQLSKKLSWFQSLDLNRQGVLIDMCFNLGITGLLQFKNTLALIEKGKYEDAAAAMLQSKWAKQVKSRAVEDAQIMSTGNWVGPYK